MLRLFLTCVVFLGIFIGKCQSKVIQIPDDRSSKLFPLFSIVRISNQPCTPEQPATTGTCFTNSQCRNAGGTVSGTCASGFGVCCVVTATCDGSITQNNTNFRTREYPNTFTPTGLDVCNVRIQRPSQNICQLRLDFLSMKLAAGDVTGQCATDRLSINGATGPVPGNLCGDLSGQHMFLDYGSSDRITVGVITDGAANTEARDWNVRATYIECNSLARAPTGCLQYFTAATGQVRMLGYPMVPHLADVDYTVCVRPEDGAGSIVWSHCQNEGLTSFLMTTMAATDAMVGAPEADCLKDYVLIMTDVADPAAADAKKHDRYCGNALAAAPPFQVRSIAKPFILRVKTDMDEMGDMDNTGFCLAWRQEPPRPR